MPGILDLMTNVQSGFDKGRERAKQSTLSSLLSQAISTPEASRSGIYGNVARVGGAPALDAVHQAVSQMDNDRRQQFGRAVAAFDALPDDAQKQAAYPEILKLARASNIPVPDGPYQATYADGIRQIAMAYNANSTPSGFNEFQLMTRAANLKPGSPEYIDAANIGLGRSPRAVTSALKPVTVNIGGREYQATFNPRTGQYEAADLQPSVAGGPMQSPEPAASVPAAPAGGGLFDSLDAAVPGLTVTSGFRTPDHNRDVGGVADSYHLTGQARDILPPTPQQAPAVRQWAAQNGMEVIPEGDHWHIEPARRQGMPIVGNTKAEDAGASKAAELRAQADAAPLLGKLDAANEAMKARAVAQVQTDTVGGIEGNKQLGTDAAKTFQTIREAGQAGTKERARLLVLRDNLAKTYTGPGANTMLTLKKVANAFGVRVEGLGEGEAARAIANQLALSLRNPAGGEGMPGAMSDADREFLRQSTPGLQNSPQGWKALVDIRIALANAAVEQAQYAEQLRRKGVGVTDIPGMVQDYANQHPVFQTHDSASRRNALLEKY